MDILCLRVMPPLPDAALGADAATALAAAQVADLVAAARQLAGVQVELWLPPELSPELVTAAVPAAWPRRLLQGADEGERLARLFHEHLATAGHRVLVAYSDCPTFTAELLRTAWAVLAHVPVVVQPAHDGRWVLVGQSRWCEAMFTGVPWGTAEVVPVTWQRLQAAQVRHCELPPTFALHAPSDLARLAPAIDPATHPALHGWYETWRGRLSPWSGGPAPL